MKKEQRQQVYDMFDGHCAYCGRKIDYKDMQVDHIKPLYRGWESVERIDKGEDVIENCFPSCRRCNFRKGTMTVEQFREELKRQCKGIMERSFQVKQSLDYGLLEYHDIPIIFHFEKCELADIAANQKDIPSEFAEIVNDNFWDLTNNNKEI